MKAFQEEQFTKDDFDVLDPIEHLASALYFDRWREAGFLVAGTIYADASGGGDTPLCLVGGWYNSAANWRDCFAPSWKSFLEKWEIPYLHQTKSKNPAADKWKPLPGSPVSAWATWNRLLAEAVDIIERSGARSLVFFTPTEDFNAFTRDRIADGFPDDMDCFTWNAFRFIVHADGWCKDRNLPLPEFVFEASNKEEQRALMEVMERYELPPPIFRKKEEDDATRAVVALQAADFLAYEVFKGWKDIMARGQTGRLFLERFDRIDHAWGWADKAKMDGLIMYTWYPRSR